MRLARLLRELMPGEPSVLGLLALELLQDSADATPATTPTAPGAAGRPGPVPLATRARRSEGVLLVGEGLRRTPDRPDPYVVQAAIAACHALAPTWADTDWAAVVSWYDVLLTVADTPVARLNRAVAVGELSGPAAGLAEVEAVADLAGYPLWHAARAELLGRLDRLAEADIAYAAALALPLTDAQRRHVAERRAALLA